MFLKKSISLLLVIVFVLLCFASCGTNDSSVDGDTILNDNDSGPDTKHDGFTTMSGSLGGLYPNPARSDLTAEKSVFNIDNVDITYHYGFAWYPDINDHLEYGEFYPYVDISFSYYRLEEELSIEPGSKIDIPLKRVETMMTEEYRNSSIYDEEQELYFPKYNHSEKIAVPKELFAEDEGWISFNVYYESEEINEIQGSKNSLYTSVSFYYVKQADTTIKIIKQV